MMTIDTKKTGMPLRWMLLGIIVSSMLFGSCGKEELGDDGTYPREPGRLVVFGATTLEGGQKGVLTRTDYSGERTEVGSATIEKVNWLSGDEITIYGDNLDPSSGNPARYGIVPADDKTQASLSLLSASGLRWGTGNPDFYAVYPSSEQFNAAHSDLGPMAVSGSGSVFTMVSGVPAAQPGISTVSSDDNRIRKPDMSLAPMLAVTKDVPVSGTSPVNLAFYPLMTAFEIQLANTAPGRVSIQRVSLIKGDGILWQKSFTYSFQKSAELGSHADLYANVTVSDLAASPGEGAGNTVYSDYGASGISVPEGGVFDLTLFVTPQDHSGLSLEVVFADGTTKRLKLNRADGTPVTFGRFRKHVISVGVDGESFDYRFEFWQAPNPINLSYLSASGSFSLWSYKRSKITQARTAVSWKAEFSTDGGETWSQELPEMFATDGMPVSGAGNANAVSNVSYSIAVQANAREADDENNRHTVALRAKSPVSGVDLSLRSPIDGETVTSRNTANCYVVQRAGTGYKFPCVHGNAIKNGATNAGAYSTTTGTLAVFKDYLDRDIEQPWIADVDGASDVVLLWQSMPGLISNISLVNEGEGYFIHFDTADQATIHEGNAVIALRDATDRIMWSWHIWITDGALSPVPAVKSNSVTENLMPRNLGWVSTGDLVFPEQEVMVRLTQDESGRVMEYTLQRPELIVPQGTSPFYSWGRKDPQPSCVNNHDGARTEQEVFWENGYSFVKEATSTGVDLGVAIQNPNVFYTNVNNWCSTFYLNLWDAGQASSMVAPGNDYATGAESGVTYEGPAVKTVYDPSPAGFCVPLANAFTGFTRTIGSNNVYLMPSTAEYYPNVTGNLLHGYIFCTDRPATSSQYVHSLYMPALGARKLTGNLDNNGSYSNTALYRMAQSCYPNSYIDNPGQHYAFTFTFGFGSSYYFRTMNSVMPKSEGYSVLPMQER